MLLYDKNKMTGACFTWPDHTVVFVETHHSVRLIDVDGGFALSINLQRINNKKINDATKGVIVMCVMCKLLVKCSCRSVSDRSVREGPNLTALPVLFAQNAAVGLHDIQGEVENHTSLTL